MQINIFTNKTLKLSTRKERPLKIDFDLVALEPRRRPLTI